MYVILKTSLPDHMHVQHICTPISKKSKGGYIIKIGSCLAHVRSRDVNVGVCT